MDPHKEELIAEYVEYQKKQNEIMDELSIEEAIQLFYALSGAGIYP